MRLAGKSRRELFEEIEKMTLSPLPPLPFEYAEWKSAKVHPAYHVEVDKTFHSVPHGLIGQRVEARLTHRVVEIFHNHQRVASHVRRSQRNGHVTVSAHIPKFPSALCRRHTGQSDGAGRKDRRQRGHSGGADAA
jgi:hypothetical protein